ncbi:endo-1,4-beta-xylanase [Granulicella cerasi]|uniref:Beta-xylanase n=1 Tax=Granulicella cerasi TaxID=741063 RepID=A0ABW1Z7Y3_9BACT|nr:endo-1,4-beta-xylanase [Granulicella cerasi]
MGLVSRRTILGQLAAGSIALAARPSFAMRGKDEAPLAPLREIAAAKGIAFGMAVNVHRLEDTAKYRDILARECSIVTPENTMKWEGIHTQPDDYNFGPSDEIVDFALKNRIRVHGHTFVWHRALPPWVQRVATDKASARKVLIDHITTVVKRYKGRVDSWDVVNEAFQPQDNLTHNYRNSFWYQMLGQEYFEIAFGAAHDADPKAVLAYNDYGMEYENHSDEARRGDVLDLMRSLKKSGVPVGAVGLQSHLRAGTNEHFGNGVTDLLHELHHMGLECWVTELDVDDTKVAASDLHSRDVQVAEAYSNYLDTVLSTGCVNTVIAWGVFDAVREIGAEAGVGASKGKSIRPLLFDSEGNAKLATRAVAEAFRSAPKYKR